MTTPPPTPPSEPAEASKVTPGPCTYIDGSLFVGGEIKREVAKVSAHRQERNANGRLMAAAWRSLVEHAVDPLAAAEGDLLGEAIELLREVLMSGVEFRDERLRYKVVQIDVGCLEQIAALLAQCKPQRDEDSAKPQRDGDHSQRDGDPA